MSRGQVRTMRQDGTGQSYLGTLGPVTGLSYDFTVPGGCNSLTCSLGLPPVRRTQAMDPGRITEVVLGGDVVWDGILDEPEPGDGGWTITAHGSGTWGSEFATLYSGKWQDSVPDAAVNNAVNRGLAWLPAGEGHPAGIFLGQPQDPGSVQIDDMLNQITSQGGLTWQIKLGPSGRDLQIFGVTATPNRLLVCTDPAARTLGGDVNAVCIRYQATPDLQNNPAIFRTVFATDDASIAKHGRMETYVDISDAGPMLASDAQQVGTYVLQRYQRAQFAGPFTVTHGQLLTLGGQPADLGVFYTGDPMACRLILSDQGWGGEVTQQQVSFLVGAYAYDDDTDTATVTPFGTMRHDFAALLAQRASRAHRHRIIRRRVGRDIYWRFAGQQKWHFAHNAANLPSKPHITGTPPVKKHHRRIRGF
jgi:hypothetical protein